MPPATVVSSTSPRPRCVGIGRAIGEFLAHRDHPEFAAALTRIRRAAEAEFVVGSGLFNGRAGLLLLLCHRPRASESRVVDRHVRRLAWHAVPYAGGTAFPGDQLMRLSMDLAIGSAGVLLALGAALDPDGGAALPLLTTTTMEGGRRAVHPGASGLDDPTPPSGNPFSTVSHICIS